MATEVVMPQMGESIAEGTITRWLVKQGDKVERDQPLFEISTDKVDAEIPSPASGTLVEIRSQEGQTVPVNQVVAVIGDAGEQPAPSSSREAEPPPEPPSVAEQKQAQAPVVPAATPGEQPAPTATEAKREETAREEPKEAEGGVVSLEDRARKFSSPLVRNIATKEGVNLEDVEGTGAHGRVTKDDIMKYLEQRKAAPAVAAAVSPPPPPPPAAAVVSPPPSAAAAAPAGRQAPAGFHVPAYQPGENVEIEPMSKIRQITAAHMVYSKATSAHVTTVFHIDMSRVGRARARAKDGFQRKEGTKLTFMPFIFKAVATALKAHKTVNASIDGTNIVFKKDINIGMAVDMPGRGLIVPVIKNADTLSLVGFAKTANDLADRARGKKLKPEETQGGTFTITNPGVFGSLFGTPVINQPQVAILGVGTIEKRPVVVEDENGNDAIAIKTMCYLAITYDHRLVDGADADRFMIDVKKVLEEDPWTELEAYV
ncbi:MAG TPA: 2-oxoglutarate dehydrogenase, E2 component, dihydrolipoamide succinyltransferase [Thermoanaerobaculia bacterium]|jgi:2-oxoglutarate dehydrogenase E2 component (dihydrolipoamide succinyltransferase)|nr:2-oxoglutarate dehydrogenase, E2 component, dihydrolipoamide succinyltransferase [Thermoanaerobaculia bacterium]